MFKYNEFAIIFLVLISVLSMMFALGEFVSRPRRENSILLIIAFLSVSVMSLHGYFLISGKMLVTPYLLGIYIPFNFLIGPFFSRFTLNRLQIPDTSSITLHCIPSGLAVLAFIAFQSDGGKRASGIIEESLVNPIGIKIFPYLGLLNLHFLIYIIYTGSKILSILGPKRIRTEVLIRLMIVALLSVAMISILSLFGFLFRNIFFLGLSLVFLFLFLNFLYLIGKRFPFFFGELEKLVNQERYKSSRLKGLDLNEIQKKLDHLIMIEKIYYEEEISLMTVASKVELSVHQLSEYFNSILKKSFVSYINEFRIRDAKEILLNSPEKTILAIAYEVGFNSKSTFNSVFRKESGLSPSDFRKKYARSR